MDSFSKRLESLSPEKQKLIELYLKNKQIENINVFSSIQPVTEAGSYPAGCYAASSAQKRLFLINQIESANTAYNIPMVMEIEGEVDQKRFGKSFQELVKRHDTLRTSFELVNGELVQRIHQEVELKINYLESDEDVAKEIIRDLIQPFDLGKAPLLRVGLISLRGLYRDKPMRHILVYDMHHIITDGNINGNNYKGTGGVISRSGIAGIKNTI